MQRLSRTLIHLNVVTREHHAAADAPWLELMGATVGQRAYTAHLIKVYGFEAPLESAFHYTPGLAALVDLRARMRAGLIVQDLMRLGLGPARIAQPIASMRASSQSGHSMSKTGLVSVPDSAS